MNFKSLWDTVGKMFTKDTSTTSKQANDNSNFAEEYNDIQEINFPYIFANKLANLVKNESEIVISDEFAEPSQRVQLLREFANRTWGKKSQIIISSMLGKGGVAVIPFVANGRLQCSVVGQERFFIDSMVGDDILGATILAECITINDDKYYRWVHYYVEDGVCHIDTIATKDDKKVSLSSIPSWADIEESITITDCEKPLLSFMKCPKDPKNEDEKYGVPITYGCDSIIDEIKECLTQIAQEFDLKRAFLGVDDRLLDKDGELLPNRGIFRKLKTNNINGNDFWQIFDPAIRDSSYYNRLQNLFDILEKQVGTSKGILTEPNSKYATATEIKNANHDTYSIVNDVRRELENGMEDFIYAANVLADYYNLTPSGEYKMSFNWSYALIENSSETWEQMLSAHAVGAYKTAELRQYLVSDESLEESEAVCEEIKKQKMQEQQEMLNEENTEEEDGEESSKTFGSGNRQGEQTNTEQKEKEKRGKINVR